MSLVGCKSLDGHWTNSCGEGVTIKGCDVHWDDGLSAVLRWRGSSELSMQLHGMGEFQAKALDGQLTWSDGDIWSLDDSIELQHRRAAEKASSERISAVAGLWYQVLDVPLSASIEDVKRAFHDLALLHHPDKCILDADGQTFKAVQRAYEEGMREIGAASLDVRSPATVCVFDSSQTLQVPVDASREKLRTALDRWEHALDEGKSEHCIDDIPNIPVEELARLLLRGGCVPLDVREADQFNAASKASIPGSVQD